MTSLEMRWKICSCGWDGKGWHTATERGITWGNETSAESDLAQGERVLPDRAVGSLGGAIQDDDGSFEWSWASSGGDEKRILSVAQRCGFDRSGGFESATAATTAVVNKAGGAPCLRSAPEGLMAVSRILSNGQLAPTVWTVICLTPCLTAGRGPCGLRPIPGGCRRSRGVLGRRPDPSCSVLHRMGFFVPPCLRSGRWAFTPPFHPCRSACAEVGGMFSVTLSVDRDFGLGPPRILRGMLPCGVRTFLSRLALR